MSSVQKVGKIVRSAFRDLTLLDSIEGKTISGASIESVQPVFIIGLPRSGSTLLYQLIAYCYRVAYFSNLSSVIVRAPVTMHKISAPFFKPYNDGQFKNSYGVIPGLFSPSEAGGIYEWWLENPGLEKDFIRRSVSALSGLMNGPFIGKNLRNSFRLKKIIEIFPEAVFIHVQRDFLFNVQSVYLGQENALQFDKYIKGPKVENKLEQIVNTLQEMHQNISEFLSRHDCRKFTVQYENLCDHPMEILGQMENTMGTFGIQFNSRDNRTVSLKKSMKQTIPPEKWNELVGYYEGSAGHLNKILIL